MEFASKEEFEDWLRSLRQDIPFIPCTDLGAAVGCPLEEFYAATERGSIGVSSWTFHVDGQGFNMPQWAIEFVKQVDRRPWKEVTPAECLDLLNN